MEDKRNIVRRRYSGHVELDVPTVMDTVNIGTFPEYIWRTLTSPLHFRASSQSLGGAPINVAGAGMPPQTVGVVAL